MKRVLLFGVLIVVVAAAAIALFLYSSTPRRTSGVSLPLSAAHRDLLARVPAGADFFALIPTAAAMDAKLRSNPVTAEAVEQWTRDRELPQPWMLGRADLLIWHSDAGTTFAFHLDPLRALLVRGYGWFSAAELTIDGSTLLIGPPAAGGRLIDTAPDLFLGRANGLSGDALVVQRTGDATFPPIERPAVSLVTVTRRDINIVSRAHRTSPPPGPPLTASLPLGGILSAWFTEPTRVVGAIDRILPGDITELLSNGGSVVLYDVDTRRLLPRPRGLFAAPDNPRTRAAVARLESVAELVGDVERRDGQILIGLDRESLPAYATEEFAEIPFPSNLWALRIDPRRMLPVAERLADHRGLRFAAPELHRSARRLRTWLAQLGGAQRIDAAALAAGDGEELRVRVTAK